MWGRGSEMMLLALPCPARGGAADYVMTANPRVGYIGLDWIVQSYYWQLTRKDGN